MPDKSQTVLVVDDDAAVRNALKFALEVEGFSVKVYDRPSSLLAESDLPPGACLVVDLRMPEMDGLELVNKLRERHVTMPAILILSENATPLLRKRSREAGIADVLEKPLSDSALVESIRHVFKSTH